MFGLACAPHTEVVVMLKKSVPVIDWMLILVSIAAAAAVVAFSH